MKIIQYRFLSAEVNRGTEEQPKLEQIFLTAEVACPTREVFEANLLRVQAVAVEGSVKISGEFDPQPQSDAQRIEQLEQALDMLLSGVTQ